MPLKNHEGEDDKFSSGREVSFGTSLMTYMMLTLLLKISGSLTPAAKGKSFVMGSFTMAQVKYCKNYTTYREGGSPVC